MFSKLYSIIISIPINISIKSNKIEKIYDKELKLKEFIGEKNKFLNILKTCKNKILFPKEMISDIKKINELKYLYYLIKNYNNVIIDARKLFKKLYNINCWGYYFNKQSYWNYLVNEINIKITVYRNEIMKSIKKNSNIIINKLLIKFNCWIEKIRFFMFINKNIKNLDYIYEDYDQVKNKSIKKSLKISQVLTLLPMFTNSKSLIVNSNIYHYTIPDLYFFD